MARYRVSWGRDLGWRRGLWFGLCAGVLALSPLACGDADDSGLFRGEGSGGDGAEGGSEGDGGESSADGGSEGGDAGSGGSDGDGGEPGEPGAGGASAGSSGEPGEGGTAGDAGSGGDAGSAQGGDAGKGGEGGMSEGGKGGEGGMGEGGKGGDAGAGGSGEVDCEALRKEVDRRLEAAQSCNPFEDSIQCEDWVEGVCCDVIVRSADSEVTDAYLGAVKELLSHKECQQPCPLVLCPEPHKGTCAPRQGGGGRCRAAILTY